MLLNREMNYCYSTSELKWSGKHDSHVLCLLVPGQAPRLLRLLPDKLADGGGLSPQTSYEEVLPVFKTGHRYAVLHHPKKGSHGWNRTSGLQLRKLLLCLLSYAGMVETVRVALTTACLQDRLASTEHASPKKWHPRQVSHPDLPH